MRRTYYQLKTKKKHLGTLLETRKAFLLVMIKAEIKSTKGT